MSDQERLAPVCPNCGSGDVREWGTVYTSYYVGSISPDGEVETADGDDTAWDSYEYVELMCRDCDHTEKDPKKFLPQPVVVLGDN